MKMSTQTCGYTVATDHDASLHILFEHVPSQVSASQKG